MIHLFGEVLGSAQLDRALTRIESASQNLTEPLEEVGDEFRAIEAEHFDAEGPGWAPLSPKYAARKLRLYGDKPILRATDKLYRSMTIKGAEGNVSRVQPMSAEFGTSIFYAIFHQTGTVKMPAREVIMLNEDDKRSLVRVVQRYMIATGQAAGFQVIPH